MLKITPFAFVENLRWMGLGMLGIFIVVGIVVGATYLLNWAFRPRAEKSEGDE